MTPPFSYRMSLLSRLAGRIASLVEARLAQRLIAVLDAHFENRVLLDLKRQVGEIVDSIWQSKQGDYQRLAAEAVNDGLRQQQAANPFFGSHLYLPNEIVAGTVEGSYMGASNALARDFLHPEFADFCKMLCSPIRTHRKLWEFAFIYHHIRTAGMLKPGNRGLGFGVGQEQLVSLFASLGIGVTATDAPEDHGWRTSNQYSNERDQLFYPTIVGKELFEDNVSFEFADMNDIPEHLSCFDFCWSSCALEHLGSLEHGIDFIISSVEKTLKVGGVACHTTELNLTSDEETVESGGTVIYRKRDLEGLCRTLEERGHTVSPLRIEPGLLVADFLVDMPPYRSDPHLKFQLGQYVSTSVGIVARRGR